MAHLERRGRLWVVIYHEGVGRGAKRKPTKGYARKALAQEHCDRLNAKADAKRALKPCEVVPWATLVERWLINRLSVGMYSGQYEDRARRQLLALAKAHGWTSVEKVKPTEVETLRVGDRRVLLAFLRFADRLDQPLDPRCLKTKPPPRVREAKPPLLTQEQVNLLLKTAKDFGGASAAAFAHLLVTYGHRPESLAKQVVGDVDLAAGTLDLVVKGGDKIRHPLLGDSLAILGGIIGERPQDAPLFLDARTGKAWPTGQRFAQWWWKDVAWALKDDRLRGVYHLKRWAITRMLDRGLDVATIASLTGHRTPMVLLTYARTNEEKQAKALLALAGTQGEHNGKS